MSVNFHHNPRARVLHAVTANVVCGAAVWACSAQVAFVGLGDLPGGGFLSYASGITPDGHLVVGVASSARSPVEAFGWTPAGGMFPLGVLGGEAPSSWAFDASLDGAIVGRSSVDSPHPRGDFRGFRWTAQLGMQALDDLPGGERDYGAAAMISPDGRTVVGSGWGEYGLEAVRWDDQVPTGLGDVKQPLWPELAADVSSDRRVVAGSARGFVAFRLDETGISWLGDLPGGTQESTVCRMTPDARVIVGDGSSSDGPEAYRWTAHTGMLGLGDLPGGDFASGSRSTSADGWTVVGGGKVGRGYERSAFKAFIWDPLHGMRNLETLLREQYHLPLTGWLLTEASDISGDGSVICGTGWNPAGQREAFLVRLPPFCYADCDESTGLRTLDLFDFLCYQQHWLARDLYSDCDQDGAHDLFDYLCFQNLFAAGCP